MPDEKPQPNPDGEEEERVEVFPKLDHEERHSHFAHSHRQQQYHDRRHLEPDNSIKTSKYTILNFVPKSLFEQFRRLANIYFLVLSALMMIGTYAPKTFDSPLTPYSTFFPLCVVLAFTMMKEAFEDSKRHQSDLHTDNRPACRRVLQTGASTDEAYSSENQNQQESSDILEEEPSSLTSSASGVHSHLHEQRQHRRDETSNGPFTSEKIRWADIRRGHIIRVTNKESIPADMIILATSEPEGLCYVETSNIDGETNLKMKRAVVGLEGNDWHSTLESIVAEAPNGRIHSFNGFVRLKRRGDNNNEDKQVLPVDASSFLLRGSSIQNVKWIDGIVVYTGKDSKLAKNSAKPRLKLSSVEKTMNRLIRMVFGWLFMMVFVSTAMLCYIKQRHENEFPYLKGSGNNFSFPTPIAYFFTFLILFSNALPMSLYVTVEMVNFGQAFFIDSDLEMYDEETDTAARAVTSNLNSDLGQVEFIFSDKTGTLTRNVMTLKRCSVGETVYGFPLMSNTTSASVSSSKMDLRKTSSSGLAQQTMNDHNNSTAIIDQSHSHIGDDSYSNQQEEDSHDSNKQQDQNNNDDKAPIPLEELSQDDRDVANDFMTCLSVAHTVQLEEDGSYRAESPDEKALCEGAKLLGREFLSRSGTSLKVKTAPNNSTHTKFEQTWNVLAVNEFSSARKRMSVLVRNEQTKEHILFCKGADTVVLARSSSLNEDKRKVLDSHLSEFANEGLRTLVLAKRPNLSEEVVSNWLKEYQEARSAVEGREDKLEKAAESIEKDLEILGATAIEDRLQDGVPETLEALREAGIKIWVLTGDKLETAINIGFSSRLLDSSMRVIRIEGKTKEDVASHLKNVMSLFPDLNSSNLIHNNGNNNGPKVSRTSEGNVELANGTNSSEDDVQRNQQRNIVTKLFATLASSRLSKAANWWKRTVDADDEEIDVERGRAPLLGSEDHHHRSTAENEHNHNRSIIDRNNGEGVTEDEEPLALAITGQALEHALSDDHLKNTLLTLALSCRVVLACRVSPGQKAQVVRMVKKGAHSDALGFSPVTLAIGDGANDVGMIQEAQIGIGISGKEGLQAVNASDFAISQFRFLKRLLLVHGRWSYRRMAKVVLYSLYKNLVLVLLLFYYQFFAAFSGVSLFESMVQAGYNFFLGMCPLAVGLFDREISARFALQNPQLYVSGRRNLNLNVVKLGWRVFEAFVHSALLFCLPIFVVKTEGFAVPAQCHSLKNQGHQAFSGTPDIYILGLASYTCLIFVMQYKILFEASSFTRYNAYAWIFSFSLYFGFLVVYSAWYWEAPEFYWVTFCAFGRPTLWLLVLLCVIAAFVFDTTVRLARLMVRPHAVDILIERDRLALKLISAHEKRKKWMGEGRKVANDISFVSGQGGGFTERVRTAFDINHLELVQRVHSLTSADLDAFGIDSPSLRSSFDFSAIDRLRSNHQAGSQENLPLL